MERLGLHKLLVGQEPAPDRIFCHANWFRGHNNPRVSRLVPRLSRLDRYFTMISDVRVIRGVQYRALKATQQARNRAIFAAANRRYEYMMCFTAPQQIPFFRGKVVADIDEPEFTPEWAELLKLPQLAAAVFTTERVAEQYREMGVDKPFYAIPHGVELERVSDPQIADVRERHRTEGDFVVGFISAWFLAEGDRNYGIPEYDLDHVLNLWDEVKARVPNGKLWLIGMAAKVARERSQERDDVVLFEDIPYGGALPYIANFDVGLYPRKLDAPMVVKILEYMAMGVAVVTYDLELAKVVRDNDAGLLAGTDREFVDAIVRLSEDEGERRRLGEAGRVAGVQFDWNTLAKRYEEILDRHLR